MLKKIWHLVATKVLLKSDHCNPCLPLTIHDTLQAKRQSFTPTAFVIRIIVFILIIGSILLLMLSQGNTTIQTPLPDVKLGHPIYYHRTKKNGNLGVTSLTGTIVNDYRSVPCKTRDLGIPAFTSIRYAIVFDAGSTGTRIHVYEVEYCGIGNGGDRRGEMVQLMGEYFREVTPGLSAFSDKQTITKGHPERLAGEKSLKPLLDDALRLIPPSLHKCTPVMVRATAGLRMLPPASVEYILSGVRDYLKSHGFPLTDEEQRIKEGLIGEQIPISVDVMEGSQEGTLAWISVNFLMGRSRFMFDRHVNEQGRIQFEHITTETAAILDLGGGSTQLVFATKPDENLDDDLIEKFYYRHPSVYGDFHLYHVSHLGFGLMEARKRFLMQSKPENSPTPSGCFGLEWNTCIMQIKEIFFRDPIYQPAIPKQTPIIAFGYLHDRTVSIGMQSPLSPAAIKQFAIDRALLNKDDKQTFFDLAYIYTLLTIGYRVDQNHLITVTKELDGFQAGWSLGCALELLQATSDLAQACLPYE